MSQDRPAPVRDVLSRQTLTMQGVGIQFVREAITRPTDWSFQEKHHTLVVHREGRMDSMESLFSHGPSGRLLPQVGDIWVIPADHRYAALARGQTVGFCELTIPRTLMKGLEIRPRIGFRDPFLHALVEKLAAVAGRDDDIARLSRDALAEILRLHLVDHYGEGRAPAPRPPRNRLDAAQRARLVTAMDDQLDNSLSLREMAGWVDLSPDLFLTAFSAAFGTTPHQFLIARRIDRAKALLAASRRSVTDIALATGFASPSHFATSFRQHVGLTPSDYRRTLKGG